MSSRNSRLGQPPNKALQLTALQGAATGFYGILRPGSQALITPSSRRQLSAHPLDGGNRHVEVTAYLPRKMLVDLAMSRNGRDLATGAIHVDGVAPALSPLLATL